jgi:predicted transcriptional regulator
MNKIEIGVQSLKQMGVEMLAAWHAAEQGNPQPPREALYFSNMHSLLGVLTPARWKLLEVLKASGPLSVYALAKQSERHYSNVHADVARLLELGLIARDAEQRVFVPWDEIHADFALRAAA